MVAPAKHKRTLRVDTPTIRQLPGDLSLWILSTLWSSDKSLDRVYKYVCRHYETQFGTPPAKTTISTTLYRMVASGWIARTERGMYHALVDCDTLCDMATAKIRAAYLNMT